VGKGSVIGRVCEKMIRSTETKTGCFSWTSTGFSLSLIPL